MTDGLAAPQISLTGITSISALPTQTATSPKPTSAPTVRTSVDTKAASCLTSWSSYRSASQSSLESILNLPGTTTTYATYLDPYYNVETVDYTNATWTTLCDSAKHLATRLPTTTLATSYATSYNYSTFLPASVPITAAPPTCTFSRSAPACTHLWLSYSSLSSSYSSASDYNALSTLTAYAIPPCIEPQWSCPPPENKNCTVTAATATMYYWPVTTATGGDFCAQNGTIINAKPTSPPRPNTVKVNGATFTSPSVYLVFPSATAQYSKGGSGRFTTAGSCGPTATDITLTLDRTQVSSVEFKYPETAYPIEWSDFNTVRKDAYVRACPYWRGCSGWGKSGLGNYNPFLQIPREEIRSEGGKEWKGCDGFGFVKPSLVALGESTAVTTNSGKWIPTYTAKPTASVTLSVPKVTPTGEIVSEKLESGDENVGGVKDVGNDPLVI
ncbi:hypothetical protein B0J14DRAFT_555694 [Halenospora varia]|nr:hypothetical protein B0J14DRAFT_555694 [Halenospora varia]